ncbi:MAG: hypothetical protein ACO3NZ_08140 [Pirellulales bacterium]
MRISRLVNAAAVAIVLMAAAEVLPLANAAAEEPPPRRVEITPETPAMEVSRYFSLLAHGPTQKFFTLTKQRVVLVLSTSDGTADLHGVVYLFDPAASAESLEKWINNKHSDALYADAAEPLRSVKIPAEKLRCDVSQPMKHEVGRSGDEYDQVRVSFTLDSYADEFVNVQGFKGGLDAFIRTREPDQPR